MRHPGTQAALVAVGASFCMVVAAVRPASAATRSVQEEGAHLAAGVGSVTTGQGTTPGSGPGRDPALGATEVAGAAGTTRRTFPHETALGAFIDPLVTEHAFVDRKVRSDLRLALQRADEEGVVYQGRFLVEYAFTRWFALELDQSVLSTVPADGPGESGVGDLGWAAKFEILHAEDTEAFILATGLEGSLPSGDEEVGAGEDYGFAPFVAADWALRAGLLKLQLTGAAEFVVPREAGSAGLEGFEWNAALSYFGSEQVVPLLELNSELEGLAQGEVEEVFALTPGVVISLSGVAGTSWDLASGAQIFFGGGHEEAVSFLVSLRHHWTFR